MTETILQDAIFQMLHYRKRMPLIVPNYSPAGWFECDVAAFTGSGRLYEFEVKLTRGDFKEDSKKAAARWVTGRFREHGEQLELMFEPDAASTSMPLYGQMQTRVKHRELERKASCGPARFWYVAPKDLIRPDELPTWAGLYEAEMWGRRPLLRETVEAPKLHNQPAESRVRKHAASVFYYRFWNLREKCSEEALRDIPPDKT